MGKIFESNLGLVCSSTSKLHCKMTSADSANANLLKQFGDNLSEDDLLALARVAEAAERYPDMCTFMKQLVNDKCKGTTTLKVEERNLLSVAYKNVVGSKRSSWRTLASGNFSDVNADIVAKYKTQVEKELQDICNEVLDLLTNKLLETVKGQQNETEVFYLKMCGDYYRYLAEFLPDSTDSEKESKEKAKEFYSKAMEVAKKGLPETHPTRLGLALNFSVCYYEILKKPEKACELAKEAFDAAIEKLDTLNDASYKDSTLIMQLLRDNLTLWTSEAPADEAAENA